MCCAKMCQCFFLNLILSSALKSSMRSMCVFILQKKTAGIYFIFVLLPDLMMPASRYSQCNKNHGILCKKSGLTGFRINHSSGATAAYRIYQSSLWAADFWHNWAQVYGTYISCAISCSSYSCSIINYTESVNVLGVTLTQH